MRKVPFIIAGVVAMTTAYAEAAPPTIAKVPTPTVLTVTVCRVDDWTGKRPLPDNVIPSKDWRDLEWRRTADHALQCKLIVIELQDAVALNYSSEKAAELHPDWSEKGQCAARAMDFGPRWGEQNKGWWPLAIGCPTPITKNVNGVDVIIDFAKPPCPAFEPGTDFPMRCEFSEGLI